MSTNFVEPDGSYYRNTNFGKIDPDTGNKIPLLNDTEWYWRTRLLNATQEETVEIWDMLLNPKNYGLLDRDLTDYETTEIQRMLCKIDRVYLSQVVIGDDPESKWHLILTNKWLYERCREHERNPDGHLDLWPRGHFKSSIAVKLSIIQEHLINPTLTVCLIGYEKSFGEATIKFIRGVYEYNNTLKTLFPEIFYENPSKEARTGHWTSDQIYLKPNAENSFPSLTCCGIFKLNTGSHYDMIYYDDIVVRDNATKVLMARMKESITNSFSMLNKGEVIRRTAMVGTRYHKDDPYNWIIEKDIMRTRVYTATHNKKLDGNPVFLTKDEWEEIKKGDPYQVACDYMMNPITDATAIFDVKKLKKFDTVRPMDVFILVDPADSKKEKSDRTAMLVIGVDEYHNKYLLDGIADKLELDERWKTLKSLHKKWSDFCDYQGTTVNVYYEKFGMNSDISAMKVFMENDNYDFDIFPVSFGTLGKSTKEARIRRICGDVNRGKIYLPKYVIKDDICYTWEMVDTEDGIVFEFKKSNLFEGNSKYHESENSIERKVTKTMLPIVGTDYELRKYDLTIELIQEMLDFPYGKHDDLPDAFCRIYDVPDLVDLVGSAKYEVVNPEFEY